MADCLVTGIAQASDTAQVEQILASHAVDRERLAIITKANAQGSAASHGGGRGSPMTASATIMTGSSGTSVPGMGSSSTSLGSPSGHGSMLNYLGGLPLIPPDSAENFNIAIAEGRSLVTYTTTTEEAPKIEAAFREAGLRNVKVFKSSS